MRFYPGKVGRNDKFAAAFVRLRLESPSPYGQGCTTVVVYDNNDRFAQERQGHDLADGRYHWCKIDSFRSLSPTFYCSVVTLAGGPAVWVDAFALGPMEHAGAIAFSANGARLWGLAPDDQIVSRKIPGFEVAGRYSNVITGRVFGLSSITALGIGPDQIVAATTDRHLRRLSPETADGIGVIPLDHPPTTVAVAPDGSWCAVGMLTHKLCLVSLPGAGWKKSRPTPTVWSPLRSAKIRPGWRQLARTISSTCGGAVGEEPGTLPIAVASRQAPRRAFLPAADKLLVLLEQERAVRVWNLAWLRGNGATLCAGRFEGVGQVRCSTTHGHAVTQVG